MTETPELLRLNHVVTTRIVVLDADETSILISGGVRFVLEHDHGIQKNDVLRLTLEKETWQPPDQSS